MTKKSLLEYIELVESEEADIYEGDGFYFVLDEDTGIETEVLKAWEDAVLVELDHTALSLLQDVGAQFVESEDLSEAEYQGRKVPLGKPMKGDVAKSKVYVRKPNGKVVKVNFGDKKLSIKKHIPGRRKSFRARHNCANPGPRWKARYWSCRAW
jgi:hypothetical protein